MLAKLQLADDLESMIYKVSIYSWYTISEGIIKKKNLTEATWQYVSNIIMND